MEFDINVFAKLLAPALTAIVGLIVKSYLEARPKLITYLVHSSAIPLHDEKNTNVNTHSIVVRNAGKRTAHNVRIGHYFLPAFQIHPQLAHEIIRGKDNSAEEICLISRAFAGTAESVRRSQQLVAPAAHPSVDF